MRLCCFTLGKAQQKYQLSGRLGIRVNRRERKREKERKTEKSEAGKQQDTTKAKTQLKVKECNICLPEIEYLTKRMVKR